MKVLGNEITYSLNMLLFLLCVLRFYYIYWIITQWVVFSSERSKRIINFLVRENFIVITFKSILKYYGLFSLLLLFLTMTYMFSLVFKILEDFDRENYENFTEIVNCLWYIMVTITTIGYGDLVPVTMLGRVLGVLCSIAGIFFIAMLFVFLVLYITLDNDEHQAYKKIVYIYQKKDSTDQFNSYINSYIKYKFLKSIKSRALDSIKYKNKYQVLRNKYYYSLLSDINDYQSTIIHSFSKKINDYWNDKADDIFYILGANIESINNELKKTVEESEVIYQLSLLSGTLAFKIVNLMTFNSNIGYYFELNAVSQIQGKKIIGAKELRMTQENVISRNKMNVRKMTNKTNFHYKGLSSMKVEVGLDTSHLHQENAHAKSMIVLNRSMSDGRLSEREEENEEDLEEYDSLRYNANMERDGMTIIEEGDNVYECENKESIAEKEDSREEEVRSERHGQFNTGNFNFNKSPGKEKKGLVSNVSNTGSNVLSNSIKNSGGIIKLLKKGSNNNSNRVSNTSNLGMALGSGLVTKKKSSNNTGNNRNKIARIRNSIGPMKMVGVRSIKSSMNLTGYSLNGIEEEDKLNEVSVLQNENPWEEKEKGKGKKKGFQSTMDMYNYGLEKYISTLKQFEEIDTVLQSNAKENEVWLRSPITKKKPSSTEVLKAKRRKSSLRAMKKNSIKDTLLI
mmetsp:Transcript_40802/g.42613  ORF Transcript_40802/g.42613 Transcript_40802/m.42613 type:complete len:681 (+) Transcript_40802:66-2108(+)